MNAIPTRPLLCAILVLSLLTAARGNKDAAPSWTPEAVNFDSTPIHYVWQGPDQTVYAAGGKGQNHLLKWNLSGWDTLTPLPGRVHFGFTSKDGSVWFLTRNELQGRSGNIQGLWLWRPGFASPEPVEGFDPETFSIPVLEAHFHAVEDLQGRLILTGCFQGIYVIENERFRLLHTIKTPEIASDDSNPSSRWETTLYPVLLADGRVVVMGFGPSNANVFTGYVVIEGSQIQTHPLPNIDEPSFRDTRVHFLRPDPHELLYQLSSGRILRLDIDDTKFKDLGLLPASRDRGYFTFWQQEGDTSLALFSRRSAGEDGLPQDQIRLWQRLRDEDWEPLGNWNNYGLNTGLYYYQQRTTAGYPFVTCASAVWIGTSTLGVLRIDRDSGKARYLNWRHGFPVNDASSLFLLPDGQIWAGGTNAEGSGSFDPDNIGLQEQPDDRVLSFPNTSAGGGWPSTQTSDGTIYEIRPLGNGNPDQLHLRKLTYQSWENLWLEGFSGHPLAHTLLTDHQDRIWVAEIRHDTNRGRATVVDGASMELVMSGEFQDLLAAYAHQEHDRGFQSGVGRGLNFSFPYVSPQKQVLYHDGRALHAYNGKSWTEVLQSDIAAHYPKQNPSRFGYLKDSGHAAVQIGRTTYKLRENGAWSATESAFITVEGRHTPRELERGRYAHRQVIDALGLSHECRVWDIGEERHWIHTHDAKSYLAYGPWKIPLIPDGSSNPLTTIRNLSAFYTDGAGRIVLLVNGQWLIFPAPEAQALPEVTATQRTPDRILFEVLNDDQLIAWRWRLNGGEWTEAMRHERLEVYNLLPGHYRVDIQTLSPELLWMNPEQIEFVINYDLESVLSDVLQELMSEDWNKRQLAIERLSIKPELATHLLQSVDQSNLSYEDRWWLKTAHQTMQRAPSLSPQIQTSTIRTETNHDLN